jgi:hypothetical protein
MTDNAVPAGNSAAIGLLLRLAILANRPEWRAMADRAMARLQSAISQYPTAFSYLASQLDFATGLPHEIALIGDKESDTLPELIRVINSGFRPNQVIALSVPEGAAQTTIPLLTDRPMIRGQATAYVCQHYVCKLPVTSPEELAADLAQVV